MSAQRGFAQSFKRFISYIGKVKLTDLPEDWQKPVDDALKAIEQKDPRIKKAEIRGANPHKSHDDPSDPLDVISIRLLKETESKVKSIHVHKDGTTKSKRG